MANTPSRSKRLAQCRSLGTTAISVSPGHDQDAAISSNETVIDRGIRVLVIQAPSFNIRSGHLPKPSADRPLIKKASIRGSPTDRSGMARKNQKPLFSGARVTGCTLHVSHSYHEKFSRLQLPGKRRLEPNPDASHNASMP